MRPPSILRQLMRWVLGALSVAALVLVLSAYWLTLGEVNEVLDDSLRQTALLLADRDLAGAFPTGPSARAVPYGDTESMLIAVARRLDGSLLFSSQPEIPLQFDAIAGATIQTARDVTWHVFTVVQSDRILQVAQPTAARFDVAAESASKLLVPLLALIAMVGLVLVFALRRGIRPLAILNDALTQRNETSFAPLEVDGVPEEVSPLVITLNDLLVRLGSVFDAQRNFIADAAHEFRSPMTALQLQLQLLERADGHVQRTEATADLAAGIARVRRLIEQLLYLSRTSVDRDASTNTEAVSLGALARAIVVRCSSDAEARGIDLGANVETEVSLRGDNSELERMLGNLVENALRYVQRGGVVDVVVTVREGRPMLSLRDNGPGVPQADRERVFERFYRGANALGAAEAGSGLGMAIVRAIATRHGATVSLHTSPGGRGLEVRIVFPAGH